jgi:hypothetical protein
MPLGRKPPARREQCTTYASVLILRRTTLAGGGSVMGLVTCRTADLDGNIDPSALMAAK